MKHHTRLYFDVEYDANVTDPESLAVAMDRLLETAMSTPGILDEYGNPIVGEVFVDTNAPTGNGEVQRPAMKLFRSEHAGYLVLAFDGHPADESSHKPLEFVGYVVPTKPAVLIEVLGGVADYRVRGDVDIYLVDYDDKPNAKLPDGWDAERGDQAAFSE